MRIVSAHEGVVPISSSMSNAFIDFSTMDCSVLALVSDVVVDGEPVVGYGFNSNGRYSAGEILRRRVLPRLLDAPADTFEPGLRDAVALIDTTLEHMVWRVVERYSELAGRPVALRPAAAYAVLDGVFQQALVAHQTRGPVVLDELAADVHDLMPLVLTAP